MNMSYFEGQELQCQMQLKDISERYLRDLRDVSEETSLIKLPKGVSEICKLALFEMHLRR